MDNMPHATSPGDSQEEQDDILIQKVLDPENPIDFTSELEPGEKADDAVDFGDLADDDLAEDEGENGVQHRFTARSSNACDSFGGLESFTQDEGLLELTNENHTDGDGDGFDDLFGDAPSSPLNEEDESRDRQVPKTPDDVNIPFDFEDDVSGQFIKLPSLGARETSHFQLPNLFRPVAFSSEGPLMSKEQQLQQELFAMSGSGSGCGSGLMEILPATAENRDQLLAQLWPGFERDTILRFMDLVPMKKAHYIGKTPIKRPKPVQPTKLNLELAPDQEKAFRLPSNSNRRTQDKTDPLGLVTIQQALSDKKDSDDSMDQESDFEHEPVGRVTWQDLQLVCEDWDNSGAAETQSPEWTRLAGGGGDDYNASRGMEHDLNGKPNRSSAKVRTVYDIRSLRPLISMQRRKLDHPEASILRYPRFSCPSLQDPEAATAKIARKVTLDLNDSRLLLDSNLTNFVHRKTFRRQDLNKGERGAFRKGVSQRYNISNDEAYDLLKENHQSKVRSTLGNLTVEHSLPAIRLQWPFVSPSRLRSKDLY